MIARRNSGDAGNPQLCRCAEGRPLSLGSLGVSRVGAAAHRPHYLKRKPQAAGSGGARLKLRALARTSRRLKASPARDRSLHQKGIPGLAPEALATGYGFTYVNAALCLHTTAPVATDSSARLGLLVLRVRLRNLSAGGRVSSDAGAGGGWWRLRQRDQIYRTACRHRGGFVDLRKENPTPDCLHHPDTAIGYPAGQALADPNPQERSQRNRLSIGCVTQNGVCLAAFWPGLIQNFQQGRNLDLERGWKPGADDHESR